MNTSGQGWRQLFVVALAQSEPQQYFARLIDAEDAVFYRLFDLEVDLENHAGTYLERLALEDTMQDLRLLRENCWRFRDANLSTAW